MCSEQWKPIETAPKGVPSENAGCRQESEWFIGRVSKKNRPYNPPYIVIRRKAWPHGSCWECAGKMDYASDYFDAWCELLELPAPSEKGGR